jgi:hypothetical protein
MSTIVLCQKRRFFDEDTEPIHKRPRLHVLKKITTVLLNLKRRRPRSYYDLYKSKRLRLELRPEPEPPIEEPVAGHRPKRARVDEALVQEEESNIRLVISEYVEPVVQKKKNIEIPVSCGYWMQLAQSCDPRPWAAKDIQRVWRGWAVRKKTPLTINSILPFGALKLGP